METWSYQGRSIGVHKCVTLSRRDIFDDIEDCLSGERGEIWLKGGQIYRAFLVRANGDEQLFTFHFCDLHKWVKRLVVPSDPAQQAYWANNPNKRMEIAHWFPGLVVPKNDTSQVERSGV